MRLKGGTGLLPGGIQFIDPRIPDKKWMDDHTFLDERAREVIQFRVANPNIYPPNENQFTDFKQVKDEIVNFNALRLNNDPNFFYDETYSGQSAAATLQVPANHKCDACGSELVPRYCASCGGSKIVGFNCPSCKKAF